MKKDLRFKVTDILLILLMILPMVAAIVIRVLTNPAGEGISITGANIFFSIPMPLQPLIISESQINCWLVMLSITGLCLFLTHGIMEHKGTRYLLAEFIVEKTDGLVRENMGEFFMGFAPFVGAILVFSAFCSLSSLLGLYPPTSDINVVAGWAILVFILITHYKLKGGLFNYLKGFADPIPVMLPMNIISEAATPVSMSFRHYGNVLSGSVISALLAAGLANASRLIIGWLPGFLGNIPILRIGIPAVLSIYFDLFSGCMQAFIFAMLTMLYVAGAFPEDLWKERQAKKIARKTA